MSNKVRITFMINGLPTDLDTLTACDALDITAKKHREKRSLNANSYFHLLCSRIADVVGETNTAIKNRMIREYGQFDYRDGMIPTLLVKGEYEADLLAFEPLHLKPISREFKDGSEWVRMALMRGSHTYDTKEMSRLIDGVVQEAKDLGIETLPPYEIERMEAAWIPGKL